MLKGVHLTLMIGPVVPVAVPQSVLDALTSVQVTTASGQRSGFQLTFTLSVQSPLHTLFLLSGGSAIPIMRVMIIATVNGTPEVLMDGVITNQEVSPGNEPGKATLTVTGEDLSHVMDLIDFTGIPYPAMPRRSARAADHRQVCFSGMIPMVIPSILLDVPIPVFRIPRIRAPIWRTSTNWLTRLVMCFTLTPVQRRA